MDATRQSPYAAPNTPIASSKRPRISKSIKSPTPSKLSSHAERNENISVENRSIPRKSSLRKDPPPVPATPSKIMFSPGLRPDGTQITTKSKFFQDEGNKRESGSSEDEFQIHSKELPLEEEVPEAKESSTDHESEDFDDVFNPYLFIAMLPTLSTVHDKEKICLPPHSGEKHLPTLVLDLDETLVHCTVEPVPKPDLVFPVAFNGTVYQVYVRKRPYLDYFLETVSKSYEIVLFTASQKVYADVLLDRLDPQRKYFHHRLFREGCLLVQGNYLKDLTVLGRNLKKTMLVDNSPHAYGYHVDNGIPIESWYDDDADTELLKLIGFLKRIQHVEDVRPVIRDHFKSHQLVTNAKGGLPPVLSAPPF